jgi:hypothetical protein
MHLPLTNSPSVCGCCEVEYGDTGGDTGGDASGDASGDTGADTDGAICDPCGDAADSAFPPVLT